MAEEKNFENRIKKYLKSKNVWYVKFLGSGMTKRGVPDILACVNGYFVGIEVKATKGKPSDIQLYQQQKIIDSGGVSIVLYPSGFDDFKILIEDLLER